MTTPDGPALELGEGFSDDEVSVLVDGLVVWGASSVSTNYSVGIADVVRLPATTSPEATLEVRVRGSADSSRVGAGGLRAVIGPDGRVTLGPSPGGDLF